MSVGEFIGYVGIFGSAFVLVGRLRRPRSEGERRETEELREVAACAFAGLVFGLLIVPHLWFLLIPGAGLMARNGLRLHRKLQDGEGEP